MLFQLLYQIMMILSYPLCCGLMTLYENLASTIEYLNTKIPNNDSSVGVGLQIFFCTATTTTATLDIKTYRAKNHLFKLHCKNIFQLFSLVIKTKLVQNVNRMSERQADRQSD